MFPEEVAEGVEISVAPCWWCRIPTLCGLEVVGEDLGCWLVVFSRFALPPPLSGHSGSSCQCPRAPHAEQCVTFFRSAADEPPEDLPDFPFPFGDLAGLPVNFLPKVKELSFLAVSVRTSAKSARPWPSSLPSPSGSSSSSPSSPSSRSWSSRSSPSSMGSRNSSSPSSTFSPSASVKWTLRWNPPPLPLDAVEELCEDAEVELNDVGLEEPLLLPLEPLEPLEVTGVPSRPTTGGAPRNSGYCSSIDSTTTSKSRRCWVPTKIRRWPSWESPLRSRSLARRHTSNWRRHQHFEGISGSSWSGSRRIAWFRLSISSGSQTHSRTCASGTPSSAPSEI